MTVEGPVGHLVEGQLGVLLDPAVEGQRHDQLRRLLTEATATMTFTWTDLNTDALRLLLGGISLNPCLAISGSGADTDPDNLDCCRGRHTDSWHIDRRFRPHVGVLAWRTVGTETEVLNTVLRGVSAVVPGG